jgi:hypothetical protein
VAAPAGPLGRAGGGTEAPIERLQRGPSPRPWVPGPGLGSSGRASSDLSAGREGWSGGGGKGSWAVQPSRFTRVRGLEGAHKTQRAPGRTSQSAPSPLAALPWDWARKKGKLTGQRRPSRRKDNTLEREREWFSPLSGCLFSRPKGVPRKTSLSSTHQAHQDRTSGDSTMQWLENPEVPPPPAFPSTSVRTLRARS